MRFPVLFSLALAACGLAAHSVSAQTAPANDQCQNATLLTNGVAANGTTLGAADDISGVVGCQTGALGVNYPEVWYAFVATGPTLNYQLAALQTGDSLGLHLFAGTCGNLTLQGSWCSYPDSIRSPVIVGSQNGLTVGSTYYLAVTANPNGGFSLLTTLSNPVVYPAQDCNQAVILGFLTTVTQNVSNAGSGIEPNEVTPTNSCFGGAGTANTAERQSKWYRFTAGATGPLQFNINPSDPNDDYDWAVWDITGDALGCTTKGNAIACNWTGARGATGLSLCPSQEPGYLGGDQFDNTTTMQTGANAPITLQAGQVYALLVDNFSISVSGFTLTFGGVCGPPLPGAPVPTTLGLGATFTAAARPGMLVEFTPDVTVSPTLAVGYRWSFGDGGTSTLVTPTHPYAVAGTYFTTLVVTDLLGRTATFARSLTASITGVAEEAARAARLSLSPNPARQTVRLTLAAPAVPGATAQLFNALGRLVRTVPLVNRETATDLDLDGLRPGVYAVRVGGEVRRLVIAE